jgi:hypothetical protein
MPLRTTIRMGREMEIGGCTVDIGQTKKIDLDGERV